jgi:hypothetical protein
MCLLQLAHWQCPRVQTCMMSSGVDLHHQGPLPSVIPVICPLQLPRMNPKLNHTRERAYKVCFIEQKVIMI